MEPERFVRLHRNYIADVFTLLTTDPNLILSRKVSFLHKLDISHVIKQYGKVQKVSLFSNYKANVRFLIWTKT